MYNKKMPYRLSTTKKTAYYYFLKTGHLDREAVLLT